MKNKANVGIITNTHNYEINLIYKSKQINLREKLSFAYIGKSCRG